MIYGPATILMPVKKIFFGVGEEVGQFGFGAGLRADRGAKKKWRQASEARSFLSFGAQGSEHPSK